MTTICTFAFEPSDTAQVMAHHLTRGVYSKNAFHFGQVIQTLQRSAPNVARELRGAAASGVNASQAYAALTADLHVEVLQNALLKHVFIEGCQITVADMRAVNGIAHVVDCVLLPPPPQCVRVHARVCMLLTDLLVAGRCRQPAALAR